MAFPFSPASRAGRYARLTEEQPSGEAQASAEAQEDEQPSGEAQAFAEAQEEAREAGDQLSEVPWQPLTSALLWGADDSFPTKRAQEGASVGCSSVAASEDLPQLEPVLNREHTNVSLSTLSDLQPPLCSQASNASIWSSESSSLTLKDTGSAAAADGGAEAGNVDMDEKMAKYAARKKARESKKKSQQQNTYGDFLGKCANSKHSEDALQILLAVRGMTMNQLEPLSQGTFARVYKGIWNGEDHGFGSETPVAIKCMRTRWSTKWVSSGGTEHIPVWLDREVKVCKTYKHPNLIQCYRVSVEEAPYMLVLEYCAGGSVSGLMDSCRGSGLPAPYSERFTWLQRVKVALDIALGMLYLHNLKVVHRDLKPQNILLVEQVTSPSCEPFAKVGDFGLARSLAQELDGKFQTHQVGSWEHMAPEVLDVEANADYDEKVDVYSFAIIMYELASGRWPFSGMADLSGDVKKISKFVIQGGRPAWILVPECVPSIFKSLVPRVWSQSPGERPGFESVISELRAASDELRAAGEPVPTGASAAQVETVESETSQEIDVAALRESLRDVLRRGK